MNPSALAAIGLFAGALMLVFGLVYLGAVRSRARGELSKEGTNILRWALLGQLVIFVVLGVTAFLT